MRARDVIVVARRRAGLTQQELAKRLGVPQGTVARWESGATEPKFCAVQDAVGACGLDLTLGFANTDEGSWTSLIYEQLLRTPTDRLLRLSRGQSDRLDALRLVGTANVRAIVVGETAGALYGWPLILDRAGGLDLLVHPHDRQQASAVVAQAPNSKRIRLLDILPGAHGYADLARNCVPMEVDGVVVHVAALVDLLRIAHSDNTPYSHRFALALDETMQLTERMRLGLVGSKPIELTDQQAREKADEWLAKQTA